MKHTLSIYILKVLVVSALLHISKATCTQITILDGDNILAAPIRSEWDLDSIANQLITNADLFDMIINPITYGPYIPQSSYIIGRMIVTPSAMFPAVHFELIPYDYSPIDPAILGRLIGPDAWQNVYISMKEIPESPAVENLIMGWSGN